MHKITLKETRPGRKRMNVDVPIFLYKEMIRESQENGMTLSHLIRRIIYQYIRDVR